MIPTRASPKLTPAIRLPAQRPPQRLMADTNTITKRQNTFLVDIARTNPSLLRNHNALYHDAQYH